MSILEIALIVVLCTLGFFFRKTFTNGKFLAAEKAKLEAALKELSEQKKGLLQNIEVAKKEKSEVERALNDSKSENEELQNKNSQLKEDLSVANEKFETLENELKVKIEEGIQIAREKIEEQIEGEYKEAIAEQQREIEGKITEVDEMLGARLKEIQEKNTLFFTCSCNRKKKIPVSIDLSTENRFSCENCGSVYRVAISASPILLSDVSNNKVLANIFNKR